MEREFNSVLGAFIFLYINIFVQIYVSVIGLSFLQTACHHGDYDFNKQI